MSLASVMSALPQLGIRLPLLSPSSSSLRRAAQAAGIGFSGFQKDLQTTETERQQVMGDPFMTRIAVQQATLQTVFIW